MVNLIEIETNLYAQVQSLYPEEFLVGLARAYLWTDEPITEVEPVIKRWLDALELAHMQIMNYSSEEILLRKLSRGL